MNIRNNNEAITEPCGTPDDTNSGSEVYNPTLTFCRRSFNKFLSSENYSFVNTRAIHVLKKDVMR